MSDRTFMPVVLSDIPALRESAGGGRGALLFRADDPGALAEKLDWTLADVDRGAG